jgi:hypothetical protein
MFSFKARASRTSANSSRSGSKRLRAGRPDTPFELHLRTRVELEVSQMRPHIAPR